MCGSNEEVSHKKLTEKLTERCTELSSKDISTISACFLSARQLQKTKAQERSTGTRRLTKRQKKEILERNHQKLRRIFGRLSNSYSTDLAVNAYSRLREEKGARGLMITTAGKQ